MCFQKEIIFNQDYITPPVAEAKKTPSLIHAILAFQGAAVQCVDNYEPLSLLSRVFSLSSSKLVPAFWPKTANSHFKRMARETKESKS